jgi:hypothetical protein
MGLLFLGFLLALQAAMQRAGSWRPRGRRSALCYAGLGAAEIPMQHCAHQADPGLGSREPSVLPQTFEIVSPGGALQHMPPEKRAGPEGFLQYSTLELRFMREVVRRLELWGGQCSVSDLLEAMMQKGSKGLPTRKCVQIFERHSDLVRVWNNDGELMVCAVEEPLQEYAIAMPPLPLRGVVVKIDSLKRFGFVSGESGEDAFIPAKLLEGGFRDSGKYSVLRLGRPVLYSAYHDPNGRYRVSEIQAAVDNLTSGTGQAPEAKCTELRSVLEQRHFFSDDFFVADELQAVAVVSFGHNVVTGQLTVPSPLPRFVPPQLPIRLQRYSGQALGDQMRRLGMKNLLRAAEMHGLAVQDHDVVCMCSVLLTIVDMTIDAAGPEAGTIWAGGCESFRGRRAHDSILVQRQGDTLFLEQGFPSCQHHRLTVARQFEASCKEKQFPDAKHYQLSHVRLLGLNMLVGSTPDTCTSTGELLEIKLESQVTPRDILQCFLQTTTMQVFPSQCSRSGHEVIMEALGMEAVPDVTAVAPFVSHLRMMLSFIRGQATEEGLTYVLRRTVDGLVINRVTVPDLLAKFEP